MKAWLVIGILGSTVMLGACDEDPVGVTCGTGTELNTEGTQCIAIGTGGDGGTPVTVTCGTNTANTANVCLVTAGACSNNQTLDAATSKCVIAASACAAGTELNPNNDGCVPATVKGTQVFTANLDKNWALLRYVNGTSLAGLGDATTLTAVVADATEIYMRGLPGNTDPALADKLGKRAPIPVWWGANPANPSTTPMAAEKVVTVGDWKGCTGSYTIYKNPPRTDNAKWYRISVDLAGCPPNLMFELWGQYATGKYVTTRTLGAPLGGIPNSIVSGADGKVHYERDMDPEVWFKSNTALNGNTHGAPGNGTIPDITANPDASFWVSILLKNSGQTNGNAGWCFDVGGACGQTQFRSSAVATNPNVNTPSYVMLPAVAGWEAFPAFEAGQAANVSTNTVPLSMLQPYTM